MDSRQAARVGFVVLFALGLLLGAWFYLSGGVYEWSHYQLYVVFEDTKGLAERTPIRMNGVAIGEVTKVRLSDSPDQWLKPIVELGIQNRFLNRIPDDSKISITSGLLITNAQLQIKPGRSRNPLRAGRRWPPEHVEEAGTMLASISPEADDALRNLNVTIRTLTPKVGRAMDSIEGILKRTGRTMGNVEKVTESMRDLAADPRIRRTLDQSLADLGAISGEARKTAQTLGTELRGVVKRNAGKVDEFASGAIDILQNLGDTVEAARSALTLLTQQVSDPRLQQSLAEILDLSRATLARFNQIASDIHSLSGDPNVQSDVKQTVANIRETTEQVKPLLERVNSLIGALGARKGPNLGLGTPGVMVDFLGRARSPNFRADMSLRIPFGTNKAAVLGFYDFAEGYKLNAQYETGLNSRTAAKFGLYQSKLSAGLELLPSPNTRISLDFFDPNRFQLDAKAIIKVNKDVSALVGFDSIFTRPTGVLGFRIRP